MAWDESLERKGYFVWVKKASPAGRRRVSRKRREKGPPALLVKET